MSNQAAIPAAPGAPGAPALGFRPPSVALCTMGLAMASFMQVLDTTIANVSLPTIAGNLGASSQQATWVITSFAVSNAIALPLTGFLSRRFGETKLFIWATLAFTAASLLCGLAQSMGMLVVSRAIQGFVCGPMYPITQSLLVSIYPREKRGQALALLAMITVVAPIAGPILGGWITDNYSWEWIFLINVPLGIIAAVVVGAQLRDRPEPTERPRMDYVGLITLIIGVGCLQLVLDLGNDEDWFNSDKIIVLAAVSVVALAVFLIWELTDKDPIVNLRLFRHRNFRAGTLALIVAYAAFFSVSLLIPQWLQRDMGYTAIWAGLATAPIGILPVIMTPFVGKYAPRFDLRMLASIAFIFMAATSFMRSDFNLQVDFAHVAGVQLLMGVGVALFFMPVLQILLSDLDGREIAAGSGLATFLRTLGGSFAASLTTYLWAKRTQMHHAHLTEHISTYTPGMQEQVQAMGQGDLQTGAAFLNNTINHQASQMGFNDIFYLLGWTFLGIIFFLWLAKPPFAGGGGAAAAGGH
ncbi:DHA2 family efflux MFS transporter permease subunit [Xanthomonas sp. NCPPB 2654]|uniref:DHA2 family efflux MFS transporter permease subunit n=1 Tax=unclassified Xanthomonas TaxID=2643310 RepID=UPI0021DF420C|nr:MULTISPECIES: DHA2 family efflux MFS transporter permease subunit [unclassified Xanthomonas]MDL5367308.1 DHA2 family efflux MFS transporter permease subunit [Xanthomonas sp. NCPPB 2654]UYC19247.1 DHA2 family efflux MFS transporter permease subunit [Xanthomonas sp. CFBP 8443]